MNTYYTKFLYSIFWTIKGFIIAFGMHNLMSHDSFEQIENDLRAIQEKAIMNIKTGFPLIPEAQWQHACKAIDLIRKETRELFFLTPKQKHYFLPKLGKNVQDHSIIVESILWKNDEQLMKKIETCAHKWITVRGIKEGTIAIDNLIHHFPGSEFFQPPISYAINKILYAWSPVNLDLKRTITNKKSIIRFNILFLSQIHNVLSEQEVSLGINNIINQELTHLVEAHEPIFRLLLCLVKQYYPNAHENYNDHLLIKVQKAHHLVTAVVPFMVSYPSALHYLSAEIRYFPAPSSASPSSEDLKPWIERIIHCYENHYGKISFADKKIFYTNLH